MNLFRIVMFALAALFVAACSKGFEVTEVQFGSFTGVGTSSIKFQAGNIISRHRDVQVGWAFSISNPPSSLRIREVIEGPPGANWEAPLGSPGVAVSEGGRVASVTKMISNPRSPFLFHHWTISDSDPVGEYRVSLYVEEKLIKHVEFSVID